MNDHLLWPGPAADQANLRAQARDSEAIRQGAGDLIGNVVSAEEAIPEEWAWIRSNHRPDYVIRCRAEGDGPLGHFMGSEGWRNEKGEHVVGTGNEYNVEAALRYDLARGRRPLLLRRRSDGQYQVVGGIHESVP